MPDCLFCGIASGDVPATVVRESPRTLAFRDINPQAPIHILVIPREHHRDLAAVAADAGLLAEIAAPGLVVSEWPPGRHPARLRFLVGNRTIAALTCGTVIAEAGERSGALNTARHAAQPGKPLMAVPGERQLSNP